MQLAVYLAGAIVAVLVLEHSVPGGWSRRSAPSPRGAGKFRMLDWSRNLSSTYTVMVRRDRRLLSHLVGSHGRSDQLIVQRLLAARSQRAGPACHHEQRDRGLLPVLAVPAHRRDAVCVLRHASSRPAFCAHRHGVSCVLIATHMPHVVSLADLIIAAILAAAMSNLSAALNSLSSTTIIDFPLHAHGAPLDRGAPRTAFSRVVTIGWALVLVRTWRCWRCHGGRVLEMGLSIASVAYGSLLGVFLLAGALEDRVGTRRHGRHGLLGPVLGTCICGSLPKRPLHLVRSSGKHGNAHDWFRGEPAHARSPHRSGRSRLANNHFGGSYRKFRMFSVDGCVRLPWCTASCCCPRMHNRPETRPIRIRVRRSCARSLTPSCREL